MEKFSKAKINKVIPYFVVILLFIAVVWLMTEVKFFGAVTARFYGVIAPFITGGVIAYILNMPCSAIQRLLIKSKRKFIKNKSRPLSVLLLVIIMIILIQALVQLIVPAVQSSIMFFVSMIPVYQQNIRFIIDYIQNFTLPYFIADLIDGDFRPDLMLMNLVGRFDFEVILTQAVIGLGGIGSALFRLVLAIITSVYFLLEKDRFKAFVSQLVIVLTPEKASNFIMKYGRKLDFNFRQYVFVQTIDGLILGTLMIIALSIFRSPYALILGLMLGIINYIPYFGSIIGTVISIIVVAFTQDIRTAFVVAIVMFIIQQIDGNVIQPKLMSESFAISPLLVIISVTIGGAYGNVMGMLIAIPIVTVIKDMIDSFIEAKKPKIVVAEEAEAEEIAGQSPQ
ncbi:MAG: AI-2E family transporter [Lachnospiraceae bacterium]|nr:AI-2E family transporter [Lachnospiraceae bacterium]